MHKTPGLLIIIILLAPFAAQAAEPTAAQREFFEARVRPVLADHCFKCHSVQASKLKGGLYADSLPGLLKGGDDGPALMPGHPEQSRMIEAIGYQNVDLQMPPKARLSAQQVADLTQWVKMGAPWPKSDAGPVAPSGGSVRKFDLASRKAHHWAWRPVQAPAIPKVSNSAWPTTPIDHFILARLEARGLKPAPSASKRSLIRRAYFDLIGLPPTPAQVDAFLADESPEAFAKVVDGLLANPHFGEVWARHWMDLVRYAETFGHEFDYPIDNAWEYRDYLIRAFNADVPYDQFVREHIAGDLLANPRRGPDGANESILATGWWDFGEQMQAPVDVRQYQADRIDNQIDVFGKTFLGLTLACARCHDHKFDAISQKDYYSLFGIIEGTRRQDSMLDPHARIADARAKLQAESREADAALARALPASDSAGHDFAEYLAAAMNVRRDHAAVADVTPDRKLDPDRLARWAKALADPAIAAPTHPLCAASALTQSTQPPRDLAGQALRQLEDQRKRADETAGKTIVLKDFSDGSYAGWRAEGWAFGDHPTTGGECALDPAAPNLAAPRVAMPGIADSGRLSSRFRGVLRSPTFTLSKPQILYHFRGHGCHVHLIIDDFMMDRVNGLLFSGAWFNVETGGKWVWYRQAQDISRYVGQRAYIEIIDDGDGEIAIDQIRLADGNAPEPVDAPSGIARRVLESAKDSSSQSIADDYGKEWTGALADWRAGKATRDECALINWALQFDLVPLDGGAMARLVECRRNFAAISASIPAPALAPGVTDGDATDEHVFLRGSHKNPGPLAPRHFLEALDGGKAPPMTAGGSGRLELARRMLDPSDPFLARVRVNRIWHHLIGRGIVASTDNFGALGSAPSHPELLDYLADEFVKNGWSVKKTIRQIMLSRAYQMSTRAADADAERADPDNLLLHRANLRRLDAEAIRDQMLAISGRLDDRMYGPSVNVFLTPFMEGRGRPSSGPLDGAGRRSIYLAERRNFLSPMMLAFDQPIPFSSMGRRSISNVPAQALILMNDPFVVDQARLWAKRVLEIKDLTSQQRISRMYEQAFCRPPTDAELRDATDFLEKQGAALGLRPEQRPTDLHLWTDLAHALMNVKEFVFLD